jgi:hypothetical protein
MLFGYDIGVISGAILFIKKDFSLSPGLEEVVVSSVSDDIDILVCPCTILRRASIAPDIVGIAFRRSAGF